MYLLHVGKTRFVHSEYELTTVALLWYVCFYMLMPSVITHLRTLLPLLLSCGYRTLAF
jgi:hypothetical protein